tara:strand:- start:846 stop:1238 length:393 start_codon:yes stop_codon:yes gene_type:complete
VSSNSAVEFGGLSAEHWTKNELDSTRIARFSFFAIVLAVDGGFQRRGHCSAVSRYPRERAPKRLPLLSNFQIFPLRKEEEEEIAGLRVSSKSTTWKISRARYPLSPEGMRRSREKKIIAADRVKCAMCRY